MTTKHIEGAETIRALKAQVEALTSDLDDLRKRFNEVDLMAECTTLLRADLIDLGIVAVNVPPMMLTEAVMAHVSKLTTERDAALKLAADRLVDAERYRFVRTADTLRISSQAARDPVVYDVAIDAARKAAP